MKHHYSGRICHSATNYLCRVLAGASLFLLPLSSLSFGEEVSDVRLHLTLALPSTVFVGELLTAEVRIENVGTVPFRFYRDVVWLFPQRFSFDIVSGNALFSRPHVHANASGRREDLVAVAPGEAITESLVLYDILQAISAGESTLRLRVTDPSSTIGAERYFYSNEIRVRSLPLLPEQQESFVSTNLPRGMVSVGNVEFEDGSSATFFMKEYPNGGRTLRRLNRDLRGHVFDIAVDKTDTLHIIASKPKGTARYIRCPHALDIGESEEFNDGKRRVLRSLPDGRVVAEPQSRSGADE